MSLSRVTGCLSCQHGISMERLLPPLAEVIAEAAEVTGGPVCIWRVPALIMVCACDVASADGVGTR